VKTIANIKLTKQRKKEQRMQEKFMILIIFTTLANADFTRDNAIGIITDSNSGLQWQDNSIGSESTWQSAIDRCEMLILGNYTDWRLPNIRELNSLVDRSKTNPTINLVFQNIISDFYWSSTTISQGIAWYSNFLDGQDGFDFDNSSNYVRCVRTGISPSPSTITHHGVTYGTVTSPHTGKVWLDRNLGASQVCIAYNDSACYGDYYQWGRNTDGHEKSNSITTDIQATDINNAGSAFITSSSTYNYDWAYNTDPDGSLRSANWSKTDGTSVCPIGFRVPTVTELKAELFDSGSAEIQNNIDAFNSFLKLPSSGFRYFNSNTVLIYDMESRGYIWSVATREFYSSGSYFFLDIASWSFDFRTNGKAVRCLRE